MVSVFPELQQLVCFVHPKGTNGVLVELLRIFELFF
jgi:hypothetical protein